MAINRKIFKVDAPFVIVVLALEIAAWYMSSKANSWLTERLCRGVSGYQYVTWVLGVCGIIISLIYLIISIKQKRFGSLITAILLTVTACVMAFAAWFSSGFCIVF